PHDIHSRTRLEESHGPVSKSDVTTTRMEAAQAVHPGTVPVSIPGTRPAVGIGGIGGEQGITQRVAEHALVPTEAQVAHVVFPLRSVHDGPWGARGARVEPTRDRLQGLARKGGPT